jgi:enoyl-CoA hydratase
MSDLKSLRIDRPSEHISELVLLGPGRGNAMGPDFWRELPGVVRELNAESALRCLIVRGEGEHFTYGLDLPGMAKHMGGMLQGGAAGRVTAARDRRRRWLVHRRRHRDDRRLRYPHRQPSGALCPA